MWGVVVASFIGYNSQWVVEWFSVVVTVVIIGCSGGWYWLYIVSGGF